MPHKCAYCYLDITILSLISITVVKGRAINFTILKIFFFFSESFLYREWPFSENNPKKVGKNAFSLFIRKGPRGTGSMKLDHDSTSSIASHHSCLGLQEMGVWLKT